MDPLILNPFAVLTFIVAPAILTNASSVMALGTSNRYARTIDRARALASELANPQAMSEPVKQLRLRQLRSASRRLLIVLRALTAFYVSLGAFAGASFTSLLGAAFVVTHLDVPRMVAMMFALGCGIVGVGGLVIGSALLVWETRLAFAILREETNLVVARLHLPQNDRTEQEQDDSN
jgi:hypothetical protein